MLNIHEAHWGYCDEHKLRWLIGENLFGGWRHETEADWERNREHICRYETIKPLYPDDVLPGYLERLNSRLAIKYNNTASKAPCAFCGQQTYSSIGPGLFREGTWEPVCSECGKKEAPGLVATLEFIRRQPEWLNAIQEAARKLQDNPERLLVL